MKVELRLGILVVVALAAAGCARDGQDVPGAASAARETAAEDGGSVPDEAALASQRVHYSSTDCPSCGRTLVEAEVVETLQDGELVRLCGESCRAELAREPGPVMKRRDEALIAAQLPSYPTDQCVVMEDSLDLLDDPRSFIWKSRLVRVCCEACEETFREEPARYLAAIDAAAGGVSGRRELVRDGSG